VADAGQLRILREGGAAAWNAYVYEHMAEGILTITAEGRTFRDREGISIDLQGADLSGLNLDGVYLGAAQLTNADLHDSTFRNAVMRRIQAQGANLGGAVLEGADLYGADLSFANLSAVSGAHAMLEHTMLFHAHVSGSFRASSFVGSELGEVSLRGDCRDAIFTGAHLRDAEVLQCILDGAVLGKATLDRATFQDVSLAGCDLRGASLVETTFYGARLDGCRVYGASVWGVDMTNVTQRQLIVTDEDPHLSVDDLELAQFLYLMINNTKLHNVIEAMTSKFVLILGRFSPQGKPVLEQTRVWLLDNGFAPIIFDFEPSGTRDLTETITLLARLVRFIVADLTDPSSIPHELASIVPSMPSVPVLPFIRAGMRPYAMFEHLLRYPWVRPVVEYQDSQDLILKLQGIVHGLGAGSPDEHHSS
jgi:uncharacterized protein YjbI with pentapeptide repeats